MQRRFAFVLAWFAVTGLSVFIATQAVGAVSEQVTDSPATLATIAAVAATPTSAGPTSASPAVDPPVTTVPSTPVVTTTTEVPPETTTTAAAVTTTTAPARTTTTTTAAPLEMQTATFQLTGGWVRIRYGGGEVHFVDGAPNAGFSMKAENTGPDKVEIEFEGHDYEGKFKADMENGELDFDIDESDDD